MSAQNILESTVDLIQAHIKANLPANLATVRADRGDGKVTTEEPYEFFIYEKAIGYKTPAVFIIAENVDFRLREGSNHINALINLVVSTVVEDRTAELCTRKAFRYFDAMNMTLNRAHIDNSKETIKLVLKSDRADISGLSEVKSSVETRFRKEIMLGLQVEHYQRE